MSQHSPSPVTGELGQPGFHLSSPPISSPAAPDSFHLVGTAFVVLRGFLTAWPCSRHGIHLEESPSSQVLFFFASRAFSALLTPISKFTLFLISHLLETAPSYLCLTIGFCSAFVKTQSCFLYAAIQAEHDSSLNNSPPSRRRKGREGNVSDAEVTAQRVSTNFSSLSISLCCCWVEEASEDWD